MKELTLKKAMQILLDGGKIDAFCEASDTIPRETIRWSDAVGPVNESNLSTNLRDFYKLTEHKEPKRVQGWMNVYDDGGNSSIFTSEEEARRNAISGRIACVYIDVPEGEGLCYFYG